MFFEVLYLLLSALLVALSFLNEKSAKFILLLYALFTAAAILYSRHRLNVQRNDETNLNKKRIVSLMNAINSYVDLLENETDDTKRKEYLERIKDRTSELKDLTGELFKYSVSADVQYDSQLSTEDVDLQAIIENSLISFYKEFSSKDIEPETSFPSEKVIVNCSRKTLMRIFDNVFSNAAKYATSLSVKLTSEGVVTVTNDAPDLTPVQVSRLFDKYYTVTDGSNSTGLGLSIAKELVSKIGGHISAEINDGMLTVTIGFKKVI